MKPASMPSLLGRKAVLLAVAMSVACSSPEKGNDACTPDDADGIISEPATVKLTVSDTEFTPKILTVQNSSDITLILTNDGTTPHSFVVDCLATPNNDGCPLKSCFPDEATIAPLAPQESATIEFETPLVEGIYAFRSDVPEDSELTPGQFIIQ